MPSKTTPASFKIEAQPTPDSCGPSCLQAVYRWFNQPVTIDELIQAIPSLPEGGTLSVYLGIDAIERGFDALLYSCNVHVLDPTWFPTNQEQLGAKLAAVR